MPCHNCTRVRDTLRMSEWLLICFAFYALAITVTHPYLQFAAGKFGAASGGAYAGYWCDRLLFYYARPDHGPARNRPLRELRRAIVMAAFVLGATLGS